MGLRFVVRNVFFLNFIVGEVEGKGGRGVDGKFSIIKRRL